MSRQIKRFYEFDRFRIDLTERVLISDGAFAPLTQKAFDVLLVLVEGRGAIVGKEELMEKVWPDTFVEESNLAQNIYTLRKALGQSPDGEGYIVTVPRRGYRFAASVRELIEEDETQTEPASIKLEAPGDSPTVNESATGAVSAPSLKFGLPPRAFKILSAAALLIAAGGLVWFVKQRNRGDAISRNMTVTALTTAGNILTAAVSPDGAYVAYATSENADQSALWIEQLSTSTRRPIIPASECRYYALTFSPDGGHVYYVAATKEFPTRSVYRVSVLGGQSKRLVENINAAVSFSPDGSKIALRRAVDVRRTSILSIANADGKDEKEIASVRYLEAFYDPAWSPDGKMIASAVGNPSGVAEMYVAGVSVGDGAMKTISARRWQWVGQMAWLDDSRSLVMVAQENSSSPRQVWLLDSVSGHASRITNDTNEYNRLSFAANKGVIAALVAKQVSNVWLIPANDSSRARQITIAAGGHRGEISWTPDGRIVYDSEAGASPAISMMESDGSGARLLTGELAGSAYVGNANVSPNGRYVFFASDLKGNRHIWRMNINGGDPAQLTNGTGEDNPYCSPDGRWVFYTRLEKAGADRPTIGRVSIDGGEMQQLTEAFTANPSVSPDGKLFACLQAEGPGPFPWNIAVYSINGPVEGRRPIKIFSQPILITQTVRWTPDGRGLTYYDNPASGAAKLWIQPLDGGEPKPLAAFETDRIFGLDWSRDGNYLACVRGLWATNVVLIKGFK
ncbi:MAG TPA: winged helix-turn-helix domain-containing protein [Blastocatellia bacterium]|nr:winged helix-turn-helix domain-containing protein [Blastocatellia bacterium]